MRAARAGCAGPTPNARNEYTRVYALCDGDHARGEYFPRVRLIRVNRRFRGLRVAHAARQRPDEEASETLVYPSGIV